MKKYIMFFISIGLLLGIVLVYNTFNINESKKVTFNESGYILNNLSERYYFYQDQTYTTSYNDKIIFYDTEGTKVTIENDNFIHYSSGNILGLQEGVLLDLSKIDEDPIIYYNISSNKEVKKISNRYTVKNLDTDLQFEQAIWKISANKYIVLGNSIKIKLNNGTTKEVKDYVEIAYSDNEIVSIYNQEVSYQTISSNSEIELNSDIVINLGTKIVSKDEENKMSLEDMVINSDDNVTLIDLTPEVEENEEQDENTENTNNTTVSGGNNSSTTITNTNSNSQTVVNGQGNSTNGEGNKNTIDIDTPDIKYDKSDGSETEIDVSKPLDEPKFKLQDMKVTAMGLSGTIKITDDNDLLSKDKDVVVKIINNETGKQVYSKEESYGVLSIPIMIQSLKPDTQYTIIASASYIVNEAEYTKNFIYKTFKTTNIGIKINKEGFTDSELNFGITFTDSLIKSIKITLLDSNGQEVTGRKETLDNRRNDTKVVAFRNLDANTQYQVKISDINYDGATMSGDNWILYYNDFKTLKLKPSIDNLNFSIDKRDGNFKLYIDQITDENEAIRDYTYQLFECTQRTDASGQTEIIYDAEKIAYSKTTTDKQITIKVEDAGTDNPITRKKYYAFKVIANWNDNEKDVETESEICGPFILEGKSFPRVKFVKEEVTANSIRGKIYISDADRTIEVDNNNPLTISYKNDIGDEKTLKTIIDINDLQSDVDENGEFAYVIPVDEVGLKSDTSYVFSVYGTINLDVNDNEQLLNNIFVGSAIITTNKYNTLKADITEGTGSTSNSAFSVGFQLYGDEFEKENLSSITFILQQGMTFNSSNKYYTKTITNDDAINYKENIVNNGAEVNNLKDLLCDNKLILTPSLIGGGQESEYNSSYYILLASVTIDGTKYENKIPITCENHQIETGDGLKKGTGTTTYIDKISGKTYTAAYIVTSGALTNASVPEPDENTDLTTTPVKYGEDWPEEIEGINDNTVVAYEVKANFKNDGNMKIKSIIYYVWDKDMNPVLTNELDEEGNKKQLTIEEEWNGIDRIPTATFNLEKGTISTQENNKNEYQDGKLHRGCSYRFSYTITYDNGDEWPTCNNEEGENKYSNKYFKSKQIDTIKQAPVIIMYPTSSSDNSISYKYLVNDYDSALEYNEKEQVVLTVYKENNEIYKKQMTEKEGTIIIDNLSNGNIYKLKTKYKLSKQDVYSTINLASQLFETIIDSTEMEDITYSIELDNNKKPNNLIIAIPEESNNMSKIVGAKVNLQWRDEQNNEYTETTGILPLNYDSTEKKYYVRVDLLNLTQSNYIINKKVTVKLKLYYDNNFIGFIDNEENQYSTLAINKSDGYNYAKVNADGTITSNGKIANIYQIKFDTTSNQEAAIIRVTDLEGKTRQVELKYTEKGLAYGENDKIIIQRKIDEVDLNYSEEINVENLIAGVRIDEKQIITNLTTVKIPAELINTNDAIKIDSKHLEMWRKPVVEEGEEEAIWEQLSDIELTDSNWNENNITLTGLQLEYLYKIRFKYFSEGKVFYMYDYNTKQPALEYNFSTSSEVNTIGIKNLKVEFRPITYTDKYIQITYNLERQKSNQYMKTKYEILDRNKNTIIEYEKLNSAYRTDNSFDSVLESLNISPTKNKFNFGETYTLNIIPVIEVEEDGEMIEKELEEVKYEFLLEKLTQPTVGIKLVRDEEGTNITARAVINISDKDHLIKDDKYTLEIYKNNVLQSSEELTVEGHSINYTVALENYDKNSEYEIKIILKVDQNNKGILEDKEYSRILKKMSNQSGIDMGSPQVYNTTSNSVDIYFYDSFQLQKVDKILYTYYDQNGVGTSLEMTNCNWSIIEDNSSYKITLENFQNESNKTYRIVMALYNGSELIGDTELYYMYVEN